MKFHEAAEAPRDIEFYYLVEEIGKQLLDTYANNAANAGSSTTSNSPKHSKLHIPLSCRERVLTFSIRKAAPTSVCLDVLCPEPVVH